MPMPARTWRCLLFCALLWLPFAAGAAVPVRVTNPGPGTVLLDGSWQFHTGDDPRWAEPAFKDGGWNALRPSDTWGRQGFPGYTGYAWYRQRIEVAGAGPAMSILLPAIDDNYAVFWNGRLVGTYGGFPPHAALFDTPHGAIFDLPAAVQGPARVQGVAEVPSTRPVTGELEGVVALRVWKSQLSSLDPETLGGFEEPPILGSRDTLASLLSAREAAEDHVFRIREMFSSVVLAFGLVSLLLYLRGNRDPILLWLAVYLVVDGASAIQVNLLRYHTSMFAEQIVNSVRASASHLAVYAILLLLFGMGQERRWLRATAVIAGLDVLAESLDTMALAFWQFSSPVLRWTDTLTSIVYTVLPAYVFVLLYAGWRRGRQGRLWFLVLATVVHSLLNLLIDLTTQGVRYTGFTLGRQLDQITVPLLGYPVGLRTLSDFLFLVALVWTVAQQQARERQRRAFLELELKSAQEIQRVLVPDALPEIPGFAIAAAYRPAQEVGGDFFQIIPTLGRGVLVVIGDVSGKGLKAAMTVSLTVGVLRTLAESTASPAALLDGLNRRLLGRVSGGFVTCLAMHIADDGMTTLANAGHLPPFCNGKELSLSGSVPLGIVEGIVYEETSFRLEEGDHLTVLTDGLPEARDSSGALFGFARVEELLGGVYDVEQLLEAACRFGQEDDITLLRLSRT